jgi:RecB family exonuclease
MASHGEQLPRSAIRQSRWRASRPEQAVGAQGATCIIFLTRNWLHDRMMVLAGPLQSWHLREERQPGFGVRLVRCGGGATSESRAALRIQSVSAHAGWRGYRVPLLCSRDFCSRCSIVVAATDSGNAHDECPVCHGVGYFRRDVPVGDPDFGRLVPCTCTLQRMAEAGRARGARHKSKQRPKGASGQQADRVPVFKRSPEELKEFSYSMLTTFEQCPRRFMLRYLADQKTDSARDREPAIGSAVHTTLHKFMRRDPEERTPALLELIFDKYWDAYWWRLHPTVEEKEQWRLTVWQSLSRLNDAGSCAGRPRDLEKYFRFELDNSLTITGSIDRVDNITERDYELIDYKALEPAFTEGEALSDLQTVVYYFGAKALYSEQPPAMVSYLFIHHGRVVSVSPTPQQMGDRLEDVRALIHKIHGRKHFRARRNPFCRNCVEFGECSATKLG